MNRFFNLLVRILLISTLAIFYSYKIYADETESILNQLKILLDDIKTLEKAVYSQDAKLNTSTGELSTEGNDILTKHILKIKPPSFPS